MNVTIVWWLHPLSILNESWTGFQAEQQVFLSSAKCEREINNEGWFFLKKMCRKMHLVK